MWYRTFKENPIYQKLLSIKEEIAKVAQPIYDAWDEEHKENIGSGGICNEIAEEIYYVVAKHFPQYEVRTIMEENPNHESVVLFPIDDLDNVDDDEILNGYQIDIPHNIYEIYKGEYNWNKIEGVVFDAECVSIFPITTTKGNLE